MRGYNRYNFRAFDVMAERLRTDGHDVYSPAEYARQCGMDVTKSLDDNDFNLPEAMKNNFEAMRKATIVMMLSGWELSSGACAEHCYARLLGKDILYEQ